MDATEQHTDLLTHHIEGRARVARERGLDGYFNVPLISEVLPGLWQGGCQDGVRLPDDFNLVISLYPWERYALGPITVRVEQKAHDAEDVPDVSELVNTAADAIALLREKRCDMVLCNESFERWLLARDEETTA